MMYQSIEIIRFFSFARYVSDEQLAKRLGISRASVHNAVSQAKTFGLRVHSLRGKGYRLALPVVWLDEQILASALMHRNILLFFLPVVDSTNAWLLAQQDFKHKCLVVSEWQENGRGRRGRQWLTGLGCGLTFSFSWRFERSVSDLPGLSLVVGLTLVRCLREWGLAKASVKWPNDVVVDQAKLAGVLIELSGEMLGPSLAVIGIGFNVMGSESLREAVDQPVTDMAMHLGPIDRNRLLLDIVSRLDDDLQRFERFGFTAFQAEWMECHAYQNLPVRLTTALGEHFTGEAVGIDASGALLLSDATGVRRFHSGEVSLRPLT